MISEVTVRCQNTLGDNVRLLAPAGTTSGRFGTVTLSVLGFTIDRIVSETTTGQSAILLRPMAETNERSVHYHFTAMTDNGSLYPEDAFTPRHNRYTEAASDLAQHATQVAQSAGGGMDGIYALVEETSERFTYGHPDQRFNDGREEVTYLRCGLTEGSCVDINTYLIASLRAAGYDAAYLYGYFFSAEKKDWTSGMHCWVATRHDGEILEWDIAHHKREGLAPIRPVLDPKPGRRVMIGHSMGHVYQTPHERVVTKLLAGPLLIGPEGNVVGNAFERATITGMG